MPKVKSCINVNCKAYNEKISAKENFCSQCGSQLMYVCKDKKCHTFLEENDGVYHYGAKFIGMIESDALKFDIYQIFYEHNENMKM